MKLRIRYENEYQTVELDDAETEQLWVTLSLEGDGLTKAGREKLIHEAWEERFNKPDYNNWHKFDRHRGYSTAQPGKDEAEEEADLQEPLMEEVADSRIFWKDRIGQDEWEEYEAICQWIRVALVKKPKWAEAFIAIRIDGDSVNDYADSIGVKDASTVSKWLSRAEKRLREKYPIG